MAGDQFLTHSRQLLLEEFLPRIERCIAALPPEDLWWRPNAASNSVGNLLMHLAGNVRQWVISGIGGAADVRTRHLEFDAVDGGSAEALMERLSATLREVDAVLAALPTEALAEPRTIQGMQVQVLDAIYHVVEHFAMHVGQIIYITKARTGVDLGFYVIGQDGTAKRAWLTSAE